MFEKLDHLETMDLSSNFMMGLSLQFFVEVERKKKLRMVYLQVYLMFILYMYLALHELGLINIDSNAEQSVEVRPLPHQAARALPAELADVLGRVLQGVEPVVPQVKKDIFPL